MMLPVGVRVRLEAIPAIVSHTDGMDIIILLVGIGLLDHPYMCFSDVGMVYMTVTN